MPDLPPQEQAVASKLAQEDSRAVDGLLADLDAPDITEAPTPEPAPEPTPEPEKAEAPEAPKLKEAEVTPEPKQRKDETDDEFQKRMDGIQAKQSAHPNTKIAFEALKGEIKDQRLAAKEAQTKAELAEKKLSELETQYKDKLLTPELEKELKELREQRKEFHIENDPDFQKKFSNQIKAIDEKSLGILRASQLPPEWEKFMRDNGGVTAMYNSSKQMPRGKFENLTHQQFIEDVLLPKMTEVQRMRLQQSIAAGIDKREEMMQEIEHARLHGSELQKQRQQDIESKFATSLQSTLKGFGKMAEKWEYPPGADAEQKKSVDKHNARFEKAQKAIQNYIVNGKNPEEVGKMIAVAAQSQYLMEANEEYASEIESRDKKIKELEDRLKKVKGSASLGRENSAPPPSATPKDNKKLGDEAAFEQQFGPSAR